MKPEKITALVSICAIKIFRMITTNNYIRTIYYTPIPSMSLQHLQEISFYKSY